MSRSVRDILAECHRREVLGASAPPWHSMDEDAREEVRRRADHLIRLLSDYGVDLVQRGDVEPPASPTSQTIIANQVVGAPDTMREVRAVDGKFAIVAVKAGADTVEQVFTLNDVMLNEGLVLSGDPAAKKIPDLGRQLAAVAAIYRLNAAGLGGGK
jgi:hypothetical protein